MGSGQRWQFLVKIVGQWGREWLYQTYACYFSPNTNCFLPQVLYLAWWPLVRDSLFYLLSLVILMLVLMDNIVIW